MHHSPKGESAIATASEVDEDVWRAQIFQNTLEKNFSLEMMMMQQDMFRRHFNQTVSVEELQQMEQAKEAMRQEQEKRLEQIRNLYTYKAFINQATGNREPKSAASETSVLSHSRNMFTKHFFPKPCDSCYASKAANQEKLTAYELAAQQYANSKKLSANSPILGIPVKPRQVPFVASV